MRRDVVVTILGMLTILVVGHWSADSAAPGVVSARAQDEAPVDEESELQAQRDSLTAQLYKLQSIVADLRQSFGDAREESLLATMRQREIIDLTVQEFGGALAEIREQLAGIDIEIDGNTIELTGEDGEVLAIAIPENIGEQISQGISSITRVVLEELPDSMRFVTPQGDEWSFEASVPRQPRLPRLARRIVRGDAIRFRDDMIVAEDEEVLGNVVVILAMH